jgi:hypothetical protein
LAAFGQFVREVLHEYGISLDVRIEVCDRKLVKLRHVYHLDGL